MAVLVSPPPCILHEDEHLLVANKPAGLNTHSPNLYAGEGLHEFLRSREARWSNLAIIHRLDKVTSGLIVFARTRPANQSLTRQFATRQVRKRYLLLSTRAPSQQQFTVRTLIARAGDRYIATDRAGEPAETRFEYLSEFRGRHLVAAYPLTGRTHQIRVHASFKGFPIVGDETYGGDPFTRVCLHAEELVFDHPITGESLQFKASIDFDEDPERALRQALIDQESSSAFRVAHTSGYQIDRWSDYLLIESEDEPRLEIASFPARGVYFKTLNRQVQRASVEEASPRLLRGEAAPDPFTISENGVRFEISFHQGYSVGLFLDQRENRRRLLNGVVAPGFSLDLQGADVLNTFAYTCGFSVCAALSGARCTSLDLSRKYLDWGQRNFRLNQLEPETHDFIFGDVFDWVPRLHKKGRRYDLIILDPPTFSRSKLAGIFQAERDYWRLVKLVVPLVKPRGVIFASTNAHQLAPEKFEAQVTQAVGAAARRVSSRHYVPQPPDFPITRETPAYLKTLWLRLD